MMVLEQSAIIGAIWLTFQARKGSYSLVMKKYSRHHQLLISTFSIAYSVLNNILPCVCVDTGHHAGFIKKLNFVHWKLGSATHNTITGKAFRRERHLGTNMTQACLSLYISNLHNINLLYTSQHKQLNQEQHKRIHPLIAVDNWWHSLKSDTFVVDRKQGFFLF